ncbi:MAG: hypothetical protein JWM68_5517, partial [Verrucomicrobiales bacterium]|nr:hypothetical protein [Verrucomicrobiales bacterium]
VDQTVDAGATAVFTGTANGTPTLTYRWFKNGSLLSNGGKISGATTTSLTITNVLQIDSANYSMMASNSISTATSLPAFLAVNDPVIVSSPVSRTNVAGTTATFTASANGTAPLSYRWQKGASFLANGGNISGATNATLTVSSVSQADATLYSVVVSNSFGTQTSSSASLTVLDPPSIILQPQGQSAVRGSNVVLTVAATGTAPLTYQWKWNTTNIAGATLISFALPNVQTNNSGTYSVQVINAAASVISSNAILVVNVPFEIFNLLPVIRANSVIVNWSTTSNSTSQVEYGLTTNLGYLSPLLTNAVTNHSILLTSLKPDSTYYYRVNSRIGSISISSNSTFYTDSSIIVDNPNATYNGFWTFTTGSPSKYGTYFQYSATTNTSTTAYANYVPTIVIPGKYDVYTWYGSGFIQSTNTPMIVSGTSGSVTSRVDQTTATGAWRLLVADKEFSAGASGYARVANDTGETNRIVAADAFLWKYSVSQDIRTNGTVPDWWANFYFGTTNINAQADVDADKYSSFAEYVLGTIPNDATSKLVFQIQRTGSNIVEATFSPCAAGRNYDLQSTTDLVSWISTQSPLVLSNGQGVITATNLVGQRAFYRLSVTLAP